MCFSINRTKDQTAPSYCLSEGISPNPYLDPSYNKELGQFSPSSTLMSPKGEEKRRGPLRHCVFHGNFPASALLPSHAQTIYGYDFYQSYLRCFRAHSEFPRPKSLSLATHGPSVWPLPSSERLAVGLVITYWTAPTSGPCLKEANTKFLTQECPKKSRP